MLAFYQLWLDDLFPKARFHDALAMVEKMGHKKRMQAMRMEWINEGKPHSSVHEDSLFDEPALLAKEAAQPEKTATRVAPIFEKRASERPTTPNRDQDMDAEMEDLYGATPQARTQKPAEGPAESELIFSNSRSIFGGGNAAAEEPPEDELDALLAEEEMLQSMSGNVQSKPVAKKVVPQGEIDEDELEAMAEMDGMW